MGPLRYSVLFGNDGQMATKYFDVVFLGWRKVMKGSFMHHLFPDLSSDFLYDNPEVSFTDPNAPQWTSLPKKVWTIWLTGYESAPISNKVAFATMKARFERSGYTVHLVTLENAEEFLGSETMAELRRIMENKEYPRYTPTMSDLIRLELLVKYGGVYMDMTTYLQAEVDWLLNIARLPSHLFLNRFGGLPKVFVSYSFYLAKPPFWSIDKGTKLKETEKMKIENFFFAAEKGS